MRLKRLHAAAVGQAHSLSLRGEAAQAAPEISFKNGFFTVAETPAFIANKHLLDLVGSTFSMTRLTDEAFGLTRGPLTFRPPAGTEKASLTQSSPAYQYNLVSFSFPFGSKQFRKLYISPNGGVFFQEPPAAGRYPFPSERYAAGRPIAVIAPLLMGGLTWRWSSTKVFVEETFGQVAITWRFIGYQITGVESPPGVYDSRFGGDVQAILKVNGDIDFSYPSFTRFLGGAPVLTTGEESVRNLRTVLASSTDPALDMLAGNPASLDLRTIEVDRQTALDRLDIRATVGAPIDLATSGYQIDFGFDGHTDEHSQFIETYQFNVPKGGSTAFAVDPNSFTAVISGSSISVSLPEAWLPSGSYLFTISTRNAAGQIVDSASVSARTATVAPRADTDFTAATGLHMPVAEAFTPGTLDPYAVWDALSKRYGLSPEDVDGVVMYTTSPTDIDYFAAGYSTQGISGIDGNGQCTCGEPLFPNLLHLNMAEHKGPLLHEFAHRWLFYPDVKDRFNDRWLNEGGHPRWGLDMTAAFVNGGSSPMGGAAFFDRGNGTYEAHCGSVGGVDGFSWLELYLMGLAKPEEVKPINDFGLATGTYCNFVGPMTVVDHLTIEYIIDANGPLTPTIEKSRKRFPVAFVLIESPESAAATYRDHVATWAAGFPAEFHTATGGRGEVTIVAPASRLHAVHH